MRFKAQSARPSQVVPFEYYRTLVYIFKPKAASFPIYTDGMTLRLFSLLLTTSFFYIHLLNQQHRILLETKRNPTGMNAKCAHGHYPSLIPGGHVSGTNFAGIMTARIFRPKRSIDKRIISAFLGSPTFWEDRDGSCKGRRT